jgi:dGTPase
MRLATKIFSVNLENKDSIRQFLGTQKMPDSINMIQFLCVHMIKERSGQMGFSDFSFKNANFRTKMKELFEEQSKKHELEKMDFDKFIRPYTDKDIYYLLWDLIYYSKINYVSGLGRTYANAGNRVTNKNFIIVLKSDFKLNFIDMTIPANLNFDEQDSANTDFVWSQANGHTIKFSYDDYLKYEHHRDLTLQTERRSINTYTREYEIDRFRVLFSDDFRRLAEITQVISPDNNYVFHNRLTHSLEVAQVGRQIAETFLRREAWKKYHKKYLDKTLSDFKQIMYQDYWAARIETEVPLYRFLDPNVVETAGLLHDIGHPPFGHVCEKELNRLGQYFFNALAPKLEGETPYKFDAFEGNAQSFRIITILSAQQSEFGDFDGLKLSTATLLSIIKYPWLKDTAAPDSDINSKKYNAYGSSFSIQKSVSKDFDLTEFYGDGTIFNKLYDVSGWKRNERTIEAEIMNYADDISYSIQDIYDFYKAGIFNLDQILNQNFEVDFKEFFDEFSQKSYIEKYWGKEALDLESHKRKIKELLTIMTIGEKYNGHPRQRADLKRRTDFLINWFMTQVRLDIDPNWDSIFDENLKLNPNEKPHIVYPFFSRTIDSYVQIEFLKKIFMKYFISSHKVQSKQVGIKNIIKQLFFAYFAATSELMNSGQDGFEKSLENERQLYSIAEIDYDHVEKNSVILPPRFYQILAILKSNLALETNNGENIPIRQRIQLRIRITIDAICSLSDAQAVSVYKRLRGLENNDFIEQSDLTQN